MCVVISVSVSPQGHYFATGSGDKRAKVWSLEPFVSSGGSGGAGAVVAGSATGIAASGGTVAAPAAAPASGAEGGAVVKPSA